jgi:beta-mannosidase
LPPRDLGIEATVERAGNAWHLRVLARGFAQFLHVDDPSFIAEDDWLHLLPGRERRIPLRPLASVGLCVDPLGAVPTVPNGEIRALNMDRVVRYAGRT